MKLYADYARASISMSKDSMFKATLDWLFSENDIDLVVECGTYLGIGSTTSMAEAILSSGKPHPHFITIEADELIYNEAVENLKRYPFISPVWGLSVDCVAARDFILQDDAIRHHEKYPDVFIDYVNNPVETYIEEIEGQLSKTLQKNVSYDVESKRLHDGRRFRDNVLGSISERLANATPLFLLDSAGGIGYFEFQTVRRMMNGRKHFIILDDIHHLKHFRSYRDVSDEDGGYRIVNESLENGWAVAMMGD
ncbi:MAG: hypothetical protein ACKOAX_05245 [Candidatus Kapaibacterium sp.]